MITTSYLLEKVVESKAVPLAGIQQVLKAMYVTLVIWPTFAEKLQAQRESRQIFFSSTLTYASWVLDATHTL